MPEQRSGTPLAGNTAIIGKVGIDQTTPGTTNGVVVNASNRAQSAWKLFAYADTLVAGGLPHVIDGTTYTNLATIDAAAVDTPTETAGSTDIWLIKLDPKWTTARIRVFAQDGAGSADNDTGTIDIGLYPTLVSDSVLYGLQSFGARAVLTFGTLSLSSQSKEPFTRTALSGSVTIREADTVSITRNDNGIVWTRGYQADNVSGELVVDLDGAKYLAVTFQARSSTDVDRLIIGVQFEV